ncbi:zinc finger, C3HC4 type (RING finger) domain-containing protein [Cardiosporidium cionae]|uniref:Zinc finger, C3HC4 type (RING finger) domain-containing protein n=1 Tax=Cardiosporidium cionae TaxID=476202 RepID=A0ABQ7JDP6_9APIC|nr:zinc finger, C3HC4 type (RING finger) domain-containing protein [Cardiosporidium cionae]|eukprot:KAF8822030.1 zinc finger, C3HC4 type (RING finger) domain-containing protein [Cardiosporidium cionae]
MDPPGTEGGSIAPVESELPITIISNYSCCICLNEYNLTERRPKILQCGHTICQQCIAKILNLGLALCPWCRREVRIVADNLLALERQPAVALLGNACETDAEKCQEHKKHILAFCSDCEELLCVQCFAEMNSDHYDTTLHRRIDLATAFKCTINQMENFIQLFEGMSEELQNVDRIGLNNIQQHVSDQYRIANLSILQRNDAVKAQLRSLMNAIDENTAKTQLILKSQFERQVSLIRRGDNELDELSQRSQSCMERLKAAKKSALSTPGMYSRTHIRLRQHCLPLNYIEFIRTQKNGMCCET